MLLNPITKAPKFQLKPKLKKLPRPRYPPGYLQSRSTFSMSSAHKQTQPLKKHPKFGNLPLSTSGPQDCAITGSALLTAPFFNKGSGFTDEERDKFNLTGLVPRAVNTLDEQVKRAYEQFSTRSDNLAKNTFMTSLAQQNQVLYFRVGYQTSLHFFTQATFELSHTNFFHVILYHSLCSIPYHKNQRHHRRIYMSASSNYAITCQFTSCSTALF